MCFLFLANGRAPLEPYYGRLIGPFTEFAHKIKVHCYWYCSLFLFSLFFFLSRNPYQIQAEIISIYLLSFACLPLYIGRCVCCRRIDIIYQRFRLRWYRTWCILLGWKNTTAKSRRIHHTISRRIHRQVISNFIAFRSSSIFILYFFVVVVHSKLPFLIPKKKNATIAIYTVNTMELWWKCAARGSFNEHIWIMHAVHNALSAWQTWFNPPSTW